MKWLSVLFVLPALAGCLGDEPSPMAAPGWEEQPAFATFDVDIGATVDWWEALVSPGKRDAYLPDTPVSFNQATRQVIADTLAAAGFDVTTHAYSAGALGLSTPEPVPIKAYAIEARVRGTDLSLGDLGLIAHYDTQASTIEGAYDNGSGTAAVVHTCIELAAETLRRGLTCVLFDAEEIGTVASGRYVDTTDITFDLVLGFDMVGINCPGHDWKQYQWVGANHADWLFPLVDATASDTLGDCAEVFDFNDRNSDESQFASDGIPTVRFAGGRRAGDYPEYHTPNDTPEFVYGYVGSRANFEAGMEATMRAAWALSLAFDATSQVELTAS